LEKVRLPVVVPALAKSVARDTSPIVALSHRNSVFRFMGMFLVRNSELRVCL
jgi:hypothetical protein